MCVTVEGCNVASICKYYILYIYIYIHIFVCIYIYICNAMYLSDAGATQEIHSQGPLSSGPTWVAQITELQSH